MTSDCYTARRYFIINSDLSISILARFTGRASQSKHLEQKLVILELSQKASKFYLKKTPEQKRLILSKLFEELTLSSGSIPISRTKFAQAIAEKVQETRKLMEEQK